MDIGVAIKEMPTGNEATHSSDVFFPGMQCFATGNT